MGSAEGRRKCCEHFFNAGYRHGFQGTTKPRGDTWENWELHHYAGTVSKTFKGLYRIGHEWGTRDRESGHPYTFRYSDYRESKR